MKTSCLKCHILQTGWGPPPLTRFVAFKGNHSESRFGVINERITARCFLNVLISGRGSLHILKTKLPQTHLALAPCLPTPAIVLSAHAHTLSFTIQTITEGGR